tara:strand:- start:211 stop:558 length:348 start_codon:yes stop_codon:yes gene_type:complete
MEGPDNEDMWQLVGDREWELADKYGYSRGTHYKAATLQSKVAGRKAATITPITMFTTFESRRKGGLAKAVLTQEQATEIRAKYIPRKYTCAMLCKEYGVNRGTINGVIYGSSYIN